MGDMGKSEPGLRTLDEMMDALRGVDGLKVKGKTGGAFYFRSRAFLHFHSGGDGLHADVRFGDDWEPVPAATPAEKHALLTRVEAHVATPPRRATT